MIDTKKLKAELEDIPNGWIVMLETSAENALEVNIAVMKILTDKNYTGLIISASRPCRNLLALYEKNSINTKKVMILCAVCKSQGGDAKNTERVIHLERISALTEKDKNILINLLTQNLKGPKICLVRRFLAH